MESRVDELGKHADAAAKKAEVTREHADPPDEPVEDAAGDSADMARTDDDPSGAVDEPQDAGQ